MRPLIYIVVGWLLLALVGAVGHVAGLTIMLPATSAALVAHAVFTRELSLPAAVLVAVSLGYLEDIHEGTPAGMLSLIHGVACLALVAAGRRFAVEGAVARALAAGVAAALVDLLTFGMLVALRRRLGVDVDPLLAGLWLARWHALATVLAAPAVFLLVQLALGGWDRALGRRSTRPRALERSSWYRG